MDFKENLFKSFPNEVAQSLLNSLKSEDKHAVLLNTRFINDEDFVKLFPNVKKHPIVKNGFIYDKNEYPLGKSIYHELGYFYLQEPSAMIVSSLLDYKNNDYVLDMCAAPGGKTIQAAIRLNGKGLIIANDLSRARAEIISNNIERLGIKNVIITNTDFSEHANDFTNTFDKIILDAPCSGSGMFRKNDKMIEDWSYNKVLKFAEIQKTLLESAYKMLKPGGVISYSTCSYSSEENEEVIHFIMNTTDCVIETINDVGYINPLDPIGVHLLPCIFEGEGQYICLIKKPGTLLKASKSNNENKYKNILPSILNSSQINKYGDSLFASDYSISLPKISIVRFGTKIGEYRKNVLFYDLHFARTLKSGDLPTIDFTKEETIDYLYGNVIDHPNAYKGIVLLTYKNNPIDIAKTDGLKIKNHYPKGLRKNFICK